MKIVISGATGNFATGAITGLLKIIDPKELILFSRKPEKLAHYKELGCDTRYGDYEKPDSLEDAVRGAERMLMISGHQVGHRIPQHTAAINAAKAAGVKHIVYTSYFGSEADNTALVCQDHYGTEQVLKQSGLIYTSLRDAMYMDTAANAMIPGSYRSGKWVHASGDGKISMIDRQDCFDCAVAVLTNSGHENKIYNITSTDLWSFSDIAKLAEEITGVPIKMEFVSDEEFVNYWHSLGIPIDSFQEFNIGGFEWCCEDMISYEREVRNGKFAVVSGDVKHILGREPTSFRDFMYKRKAIFMEAIAEANT